MQQNIKLHELIAFLGSVPGFGQMPKNILEQFIAPIILISTYDPGQTILQRGSAGTSLFILYQGRVGVRLNPNQEEMIYVDAGNLFGEMALVSNKPRMADVVAATPVTVLVLDVETFRSVMMREWRVAKAFANLIGGRIVETEMLKLSTE